MIEIQNCSSNEFTPDNNMLIYWTKLAYNKTHDIVIRIVDEKEILQLNQTYCKKNKITNILSFPFESSDIPEINNKILGDIVVCAKVINNEALNQNKLAINHWAHIVIHGILHLQGYDHVTNHDAKIMEDLEIKLLEKLNIENPY